MIVPAEQSVGSQSELVAGHELSHACRASETLEMIDLGLGSHDEVVLVEGQPALVALGAE